MFGRTFLSVNRRVDLKSTITRSLGAAGRFLLPPTCLACGGAGRVVPAGPAADGRTALDLCERCERDLPQAAPVDLRVGPWSRVVAPFRYAFPVDAWVCALKFEHELAAGRLLGLLLAAARRAQPGPLPDLVLPVPLHRARLAERGFNQAAVMAQHAARALARPCAPRALERCRATAEQSHLRGAARAGNVVGAFRARPGQALGGLHVALVDDVLTTGSTAREATRVLCAAGAAAVELWVPARAAPPRDSGAVDLIEQDADEDRHADVVVVLERAQARRGLPPANLPLLPGEK